MDKAVDLIKVLPEEDIPLLGAITNQYLEESDNTIMMIHDIISPLLIYIFNAIHFDKIRIEVVTDPESDNRAVVIFNKEATFEVRFIFDDEVEDCGIVVPATCYNDSTLKTLQDTINIIEKLLVDFASYYENLDNFCMYNSDEDKEDLMGIWNAPRGLTTVCSNPATVEIFAINKTISTYLLYDNDRYVSCFGRAMLDDETLFIDLVYYLNYVKGNKQIIVRVDTDHIYEFNSLKILALNKDNFTPLSYREAKELYIEVGKELNSITPYTKPTVKPTTLS